MRFQQARRARIRARLGAATGDEARRFNRLDEAIAAYRSYLEKAPHDLGIQLRLAGVLREAGRVDEAVVCLTALAASRPDKVKAKLALADTLDEMGAVDRALALYADVLGQEPSNGLARDALVKIENAATVARLKPPAPPHMQEGVRRVHLRIAAEGASADAVMATVRSARSAANAAWSVSASGFKGDLSAEGVFAGDRALDDGVAELHVEAGVVLKAGAVDWLLWAMDQGAEAAYADHETFSDEALLQSAPDLFDLKSNPAPPCLAMFRRKASGSSGHVPARLEEAMTAGAVMHIPLVLSVGGQTRPLGVEAGPRTLSEDRVLVVIPTRDAVDDLVVMVKSLIKAAAQPKALDIVVVDNGSRRSILAEVFGDACGAMVSVIRIDEAFNWSRLNNQACAGRDQPILVFANNDMEMRTAGWDDHLRSLLSMEQVGIVGARLIYPNGLLQHGGIVMGGLNGEPLHDGWRAGGDDAGPLGRWRRRRPATAVTGGFMAVRRTLFEAAGGFDEVELPISCSDVDLCLKAGAQGWAVLYAPEIELTHHESLTRGHAHDSAQQRRAEAEMRVLLERWGDAAAYDPTRNPQWETRGIRLYAGRRPLTTDQAADWALKTARRLKVPPQADTPTLA